MSSLEDLRRKQAIAEMRLEKAKQKIKAATEERDQRRRELNDILAQITIIELDRQKNESFIGDMVAHRYPGKLSIGRKVPVTSLDEEVKVPINIERMADDVEERFEELKREQINYERQLDQNKYGER